MVLHDHITEHTNGEYLEPGFEFADDFIFAEDDNGFECVERGKL